MNEYIHALIYRIARNPVLIAGVLAAVQAVVDGAPVRAAASVLLSLLVRQFTSPAFEVEHREEEAYIIGVKDGVNASP